MKMENVYKDRVALQMTKKLHGNTVFILVIGLLGLVIAAMFPLVVATEDESLVKTTDIDPANRIVMPDRGLSSHRGENHIHPENTLIAFQEAIRAGAHQIELDIYLTDHGDLVVIHDVTVDRTTDGSGDVRRMTLDEIKKLDAGSWKAPRFAGEQIPTLDEALEIMPRNVWLNLHVKGGYETGAAVANTVLEHDRQHQAFLATGRAGANGAQAVSRDILICNMDHHENVARYIEETIEYGHAFIQLYHRHEEASAEQIRQLKDAGVRVNYFGTNNARELRELFERGIDFPLVDNLLPMMEKAKSLGIEPLVPIY